MKWNANVEMIELVAKALAPDLLDKIVFIGGAATGLYVDDLSAPPVTVSTDIDCLVEITSKLEFSKLEKELQKRGFKRPTDEEDQKIICRWSYGSVIVDFLPLDESILGFASHWYRPGIENKTPFLLPSGKNISILSPTYFIATKLEAHHARGGNDLRLSSDLEDIIAVVDGCSALKTSFFQAPADVRNHLATELQRLLARGDFLLEAIEGFLRHAPDFSARAARVLTLFRELR